MLRSGHTTRYAGTELSTPSVAILSCSADSVDVMLRMEVDVCCRREEKEWEGKRNGRMKIRSQVNENTQRSVEIAEERG